MLAVTKTASLVFADVNSTIISKNWVAALEQTCHSYLPQLKTACIDGQSGCNSRADISPLSRNSQTWPTFDAKPKLQTARDPLLPLLWTVSHLSVGGCLRKLPPALYVNRNIFKSCTSEVNPLFESFVASVRVTKCSFIIFKQHVQRHELILETTLSPGARFSKDPKTLRARKAIPKTTSRSFFRAGLFICC